MKTEINLNVLYPINMDNDIYEFEFFEKFNPNGESLTITCYVVPRYSIDGKNVRNIQTSCTIDRLINPDEFFGVLTVLKELQTTVNDFKSTTDELNRKYYNAVYDYFHTFGAK